MASLVGFFKAAVAGSGPIPAKNANALRFGILGAARIAPSAFIGPAKSHADVVIAAVAARDEAKAREYAKKHSIEKVYFGKNGYQEMLDDSTIDAIYNPLPNALHYEWTMRALAAGKHVLLEKPSCDTAEEARAMFAFAAEKNLVLLEAFHYLFHPAVRRTIEIVKSGELGRLELVSAALAVPSMFISADDIRYNFKLGGGAMMDMGVYPLSYVRALAGSDPEIVSAKPTHAADPQVDSGMTAELAFPGGAKGSIECNFALPKTLGAVPRIPLIRMDAKCEKGSISLFNFVLPHGFHYIDVTINGSKRTETHYIPKEGKGAAGWSTYRYQLEAFVDKVRGREPHFWYTPEDSIKQMELVEQVYAKAGLPSRPGSSFKLA